MNDQELRDAVICWKLGDTKYDSEKSLGVLIDCAERVLAAGEKLPNLKKCGKSYECKECPYREHACDIYEKIKILDDCRAVIAKNYVPLAEYEKMKAELETMKRGVENKTPRHSDVKKLLQELALSDCGDNSCMFAGHSRGGQRTNGGCRCKDRIATKIEQLFEPLSHASQFRRVELQQQRIVELEQQLARGKLTVEEVARIIFKGMNFLGNFDEYKNKMPTAKSFVQSMDIAQAIVAAQEKRGT